MVAMFELDFCCHRYWQAKVMAFSDDGKWMDLERFSKSKKPPPIGFEVNIASSKHAVSGHKPVLPDSVMHTV